MWSKWDKDYLYNVVNETVIKVTQKMIGVTLKPSFCALEDMEKDWAAIRLVLTGLDSGCFSFYYRAQPQVYRMIAEKMKGQPIVDTQDMEMYLKEYFNILCGQIISRINRETKSSMRFGIPTYHEKGIDLAADPAVRICYECMGKDGTVSITGVGKKITAD